MKNSVSKPERPEDPKPVLIPCGLVMPISEIDGCSAEHWARVRKIIEESLKDTDFEPALVSEREDTGIIQATIVQHLADDPIVVCDVSARNPNVMFELGLRLAFNKPVVIIKDDKTAYPFDTSPLQYIEYRRDLRYPDVQKFEIDLAKKVQATYNAVQAKNHPTFLEHFGRLKAQQDLPTKEVAIPQAVLDQLAEINARITTLSLQKNSIQETPFEGELFTLAGSGANLQEFAEAFMKSPLASRFLLAFDPKNPRAFIRSTRLSLNYFNNLNDLASQFKLRMFKGTYEGD